MEISKNKIETLAKLYYQPTRYCYELRKIGAKLVTDEEKKQIQVFVPTNLEWLGMRIPDLKKIASETVKMCKDRKEIIFELITKLWSDATREGRQICAEILVKTSGKYPEETFEFIQKRITQIGDWEICDRLACMSIKKLLKNDFSKFKNLIPQWIAHENLWVRRFGTVCLVTLTFLGHPSTDYITKNLAKVMDDREYYVKKSAGWVLRELTKHYDPKIAYNFMVKYCKTENKDTKWILRDGSEKLSKELRQKILDKLKKN